MIGEIIKRIKFCNTADRIGPDMFSTHWRLYFRSTMRHLCEKKFKRFAEGADFRPGAYADACSKIEIGANVVIRPNSFLFADPTEGGGGILIEDNVLIGSGVHLYANNHEFKSTKHPIITQGYPRPRLEDSIVIRSGSWIGANTIVLPGVIVGENSVVGAGSILTKTVPPRVVVAGNPARIIRHL